MSSAYHAGEPAPRPESECSSPEPGRDEMLQQVIAQTLNAAPTGQSDSASSATFRSALEQYCGQPFVADPIGLEMVRAVLLLKFPRDSLSESLFDQSARQITATLCDDPVARQRLESLWARLCEAQ